MTVDFTVPGIPVGKARPRVTIHGTYTPKKTRDYEGLIRRCWAEQSGRRLPDGLPIKLKLTVCFPIPQSYSKKLKRTLPGKPHNKLPDLDNCIKAASDGCQGYAFKNDSCIYSIEAVKVYAQKPGMRIVLEAMEHEEKS